MNEVRYITEAALDAMHAQYAAKARQHEELAVAAAGIIAQLARQLAVARGKLKDYDTLLARVNEQEWAFQNVLAWRVENEHLWGLVAELDKMVREYEEGIRNEQREIR